MKSLSFAAAAVLCLLSGSAAASSLFAVQFPGATPFFEVDQASGALATISANVGTPDIGDLTSDTRPGSGTIWGINIPDNELLTIDSTTGLVSGSVILDTDGITSLAFDPVSGRLFGNSTPAFGNGLMDDELFEINPATGATNSIGIIDRFANIFALGFDQSGRLFGVSDVSDELLEISTATGAGNAVGAVLDDTGAAVSSMFDIASRPEDDTMFLVSSGTASLYTLNTSTATASLVGPYSPASTNLVGLAFLPVPEPGSIGLLLLGGLGFVLVGGLSRACA